MEERRMTVGEIIDETFNAYFNKSVEIGNKIDYLLKDDYLTVSKVQKAFMLGYAKASILLDEMIDLGYLKERNSKMQMRINKEFLDEISHYMHNFLIKIV